MTDRQPAFHSTEGSMLVKIKIWNQNPTILGCLDALYDPKNERTFILVLKIINTSHNRSEKDSFVSHYGHYGHEKNQNKLSFLPKIPLCEKFIRQFSVDKISSDELVVATLLGLPSS